MRPVPDHGEPSYKGLGRLVGRKALVTDGDSGVGRTAAIAYAREGADVVINYPPEEQSDADEVVKLIEAERRKAVAIPGDARLVLIVDGTPVRRTAQQSTISEVHH